MDESERANVSESARDPDILPVVLIAGPTASGKSKIAVELANAIGGAIVNADSMQVYQELHILTARPSAEDEMKAPHHLYGTVPASEAYSVGRWIADVTPIIHQLRAKGVVPIIVGGTGLYFRALTDGLAEMPEIPEEVRSEVRALYQDLGAEQFHAKLAAADPAAAQQIGVSDSQRMIRAYEVLETSGRSIVDWQGDSGSIGGLSAPMVRFALSPAREDVYARTEARLGQMIGEGALDEVADLLALKLDPALPAMKALGVPDFIRHLEGEITLDEALELARTATRRYAKRQMTWIRNQMVSWNSVFPQQNNNNYPEIFAKISDLGLT